MSSEWPRILELLCHCLGPRLPWLRCPRVRPEGTCRRTCSARVGGAGGQRKGGGRREGRPQGPRPSGRGLGVRAARARSAPESRLLTWQNPCSRPSLFSAGKVLPPGSGFLQPHPLPEGQPGPRCQPCPQMQMRIPGGDPAAQPTPATCSESPAVPFPTCCAARGGGPPASVCPGCGHPTLQAEYSPTAQGEGYLPPPDHAGHWSAVTSPLR